MFDRTIQADAIEERRDRILKSAPAVAGHTKCHRDQRILRKLPPAFIQDGERLLEILAKQQAPGPDPRRTPPAGACLCSQAEFPDSAIELTGGLIRFAQEIVQARAYPAVPGPFAPIESPLPAAPHRAIVPRRSRLHPRRPRGKRRSGAPNRRPWRDRPFPRKRGPTRCSTTGVSPPNCSAFPAAAMPRPAGPSADSSGQGPPSPRRSVGPVSRPARGIRKPGTRSFRSRARRPARRSAFAAGWDIPIGDGNREQPRGKSQRPIVILSPHRKPDETKYEPFALRGNSPGRPDISAYRAASWTFTTRSPATFFRPERFPRPADLHGSADPIPPQTEVDRAALEDA